MNTSRIDPGLLIVDGPQTDEPTVGVMRLAASKQVAVGIMIGVVTDCFVVNYVMVGGSSSEFPIHRITIAPFPQEMRRDTSVWGRIFRFQMIPGSISDQGLSFLTRRKVDKPAGASLTPKKEGLFTTVKSPVATSTMPTLVKGNNYPPSRGFGDNSKFRCLDL